MPKPSLMDPCILMQTRREELIAPHAQLHIAQLHQRLNHHRRLSDTQGHESRPLPLKDLDCLEVKPVGHQ
jgi:hypothetical protein